MPHGMNGLEGVLTVAELHSPLLHLPPGSDDPERVPAVHDPDDDWDMPLPRVVHDDDANWESPAPMQGELILPTDLDRMTRSQLMTKDERGLTPRMAVFVKAYVETAGNATAAAKRAGCSVASAHVFGARWLRNPAVIGAIKREVGITMVSALPALVREQVRLALNANSEFVRQQAGAKLIEQIGTDQPEAKMGRVSVVIDLG